jgi:hypothetical protein
MFSFDESFVRIQESAPANQISFPLISYYDNSTLSLSSATVTPLLFQRSRGLESFLRFQLTPNVPIPAEGQIYLRFPSDFNRNLSLDGLLECELNGV